MLAVFYYLAKFVSGFIGKLLAGVDVDGFARRIGLGVLIGDTTSIPQVVAGLVFCFIVFSGLVTAVNILGFDDLTLLLNEMFEITLQIVFGLVVLAIGSVIAGFAYRGVRASQDSEFLASIARYTVLALFAAIALRTMGIADDIINLAFGLTLGALAVAFALSFGLGGPRGRRQADGSVPEQVPHGSGPLARFTNAPPPPLRNHPPAPCSRSSHLTPQVTAPASRTIAAGAVLCTAVAKPPPMQHVDILAVGAHPDDVELSCAGTLIAHIRRGHTVGLLDLTRGELGTRGSAELRDREAANSAALMGASFRENLDLGDGTFANDDETRRRIIAVIRACTPRLVLANALTDRHPDHGRGAKLTADACFLRGPPPHPYRARRRGPGAPPPRGNSCTTCRTTSGRRISSAT